MVVLTLWWFEQTHTHTYTYIIILLSHFCWCFVLWWFVPRQRSSPGASSFVALFFFSFLFFNIGKSPLCNASSLVLLHLVFVVFFFSCGDPCAVSVCSWVFAPMFVWQKEDNYIPSSKWRSGGEKGRDSKATKLDNKTKKKKKKNARKPFCSQAEITSFLRSFYLSNAHVKWKRGSCSFLFLFLFFCVCCRCDRAKCTWLRKSNRGQNWKKKKKAALSLFHSFFFFHLYRGKNSNLLSTFFFFRSSLFDMSVTLLLFL